MRSYAAIAGVVAAAWLAMAIAEVSEAADRPGRGDQGPVPGAPESDEQEIRELQVAPPAYPRDRDLAEFTLRNQAINRFFIDTSTLAIGKDRILRFVLVVRTPSDETNVRFAAIRCEDREWKDIAFAGDDHSWKIDENAQWRRIQELRYNNFQETLYNDYFCTNGVMSSHVVGDTRKLVKLLRHPPKPDPRIPNRND
jgi:hypothetical protein